MACDDNPFARGIYNGHQTYLTTVDERVDAVRRFDRAQCEAARRVPDLQKTVLNAVRARLRQLDRSGAN